MNQFEASIILWIQENLRGNEWILAVYKSHYHLHKCSHLFLK